jgi:hypothetical protein
MNIGTGAAGAATFLAGIVQNQRTNHIKSCMEKRKFK